MSALIIKQRPIAVGKKIHNIQNEESCCFIKIVTLSAIQV